MNTLRIICLVHLLALSACAVSEPPTICEECLAGQDPLSSPPWIGTGRGTPYLGPRDPNAFQPMPVVRGVTFTTAESSITGVCESPLHLVDGRFRASAGFTCWTHAYLPAFLANDSSDTWSACGDVTVVLYNLDTYRQGTGEFYAEGGGAFFGCSRAWYTVLFQVRAAH